MIDVPTGTDIGGIELLHSSPGRIRLRVPEIKGDPDKAREVEQQFVTIKLLRRVEANPVTGSLLLQFDPADSASIVELAQGFLPEFTPETLVAPPNEEADVEAVTPSAVQEVMTRLRAINAQVRSATGGLDLRILVPAVLVVLGVATLITDKKRKPAWYNYFWFAFGTFCTLNRRMATEPIPEDMPTAAYRDGDRNGYSDPQADPARSTPPTDPV